MRIDELIRNTPDPRGQPLVELVRGSAPTEILDITEDSRDVAPGTLFVARRGGSHDGRRFIPDAIGRGAAAVLTDRPAPEVDEQVAVLLAEDVPLAASARAERFFGDPSRRLTLIGVTGTNGKTTTAFLVRHLLNHAGRRCGLMSTVLVDDGRESAPASLTTPPGIEISRALGRMVANGCDAAVMETSSHALHQGRTAALRFAIAAFSNLSGDHLDYHASMTEYAEAKAILFDSLDADGVAIVNADDPVSERMLRSTRARTMRVGLEADRTDCRAEILGIDPGGTDVAFHTPRGAFELRLPLVGAHNVANALLAAAIVAEAGLDDDAIRAGLAACAAPPGRLEPVTTPDDPFAVLVDYAHTDAALANVLRAVRGIVPGGGRLVLVFGCGGDRDRTKRPRMAQAACHFADRIIVTSDNPRTEDPERIVEDILEGVDADSRPRTEAIVDRRQAIHRAIETGRAGDVVLIAGKGHEDYQIIGETKHPFDDRQVAREALEAVRGSAVSA